MHFVFKMKTFTAKQKDIIREWYVVDASQQPLGRLASQVAVLLKGKHKPIYTPHLDTGDFVIIVNAEKVKVTGKKVEQKTYYRHSGYLGGLKQQSLAELISKKPEEVIYKAVYGMLPHNRLGRKMIKKLKVYAGSEHPHGAQNPKAWELKD